MAEAVYGEVLKTRPSPQRDEEDIWSSVKNFEAIERTG
jgi:hypothetical protein